MVATAMRGWRGLVPALLATLALGYLVAMVVSGAMPVQRQLVRFEAKGVLKDPPERIRRVELSRGPQRVTLLRTGEKQWTTVDGADIGAVGGRVSMAVQMMHTSAPVRELEEAELAGLDSAPFGLDTPQIAAALYEDDAAPVLAVRFGARNPEEYLQYMRIDGDARLYLMSRFVGEEWTEAMNAIVPR
jgi:hypothetical protein